MQIGKMKFTALLTAAFLAGVLLTVGVVTAVLFMRNGGDASMDLYEKYSKTEQLLQTVEEIYYQDVDETALMEGSYKGLVEALGDPYSAYMTADEYSNWIESLTGEYSGVGITFTEDEEGNFIIVSVTKDSPAERNGLLPGDILLHADGMEYEDMELLSNAIKGEAGTDVTIGYSRDGEERFANITREEIVQHSVSHEMLDDDTGYIGINAFIESTVEDFEEALSEIEENGAENLVLDLRDNGGGLVDQCIEVADAFLEEGPVVIMEGKDGQRQEYKAEAGSTDLGLVVLVNENSASAAEILAAALQDNGVKLVGQTTFGKGVIQSTGGLEDGSALKLTIMQYFSPEGDPINEKGIKPDYEVENEDDVQEDAQMKKALQLIS